MARPRQGIGFVQHGVVYTGVRLRGGGRKVWPVHGTDSPPAGVPLAVPWAKAVSLAYQARYDRGEWDPEAPVQPTLADKPEPAPNVMAVARYWVKTLPAAAAIDDGRRLEVYLPDSNLGSLPITNVTPSDIREFITWLAGRSSRRGGKLAPRTIRNVHDVVRRVFNWAASKDVGLLSANPCTQTPDNLPEVRDKHPEFRANARFSRAEVIALISDPRVPMDRQVLYALLLLTGCRFGEVAALRWRHWTPELQPLGRLLVALSIERNTKEEKLTKTGVAREVPVHPTLAITLTDWQRQGWPDLMLRKPEPDDLLIPSREGRPRSVRHTHTRLQEDLDRLGYKGRRVHDTRRTFISLCRDDGARSDVLRHVTHGARQRDMMDAYSTLGWATYCTEVALLQLALPTTPGSSVTGFVTKELEPMGQETENPVNPRIHRAYVERGGRDSNPSEHHEIQQSSMKCSGASCSGEQFEAPDGGFVTGFVTAVTPQINLVHSRAEGPPCPQPATVHCPHCAGTGRVPLVRHKARP